MYTNTDVIAVDQDPLGKQGHQVSSSGGLDVLAKPLSNGDVAVVLFNENGSSATISTSAAAVGLPSASSYKLTNLWSKVVATGSGTSVGGTYELVGASSARCLDVFGAQTAPGTKVEIWDCNNGANQRWTPTSAGELRVYNGTMCLDAYDNQTSPGTKVELWTCNGGANQQWSLR